MDFLRQLPPGSFVTALIVIIIIWILAFNFYRVAKEELELNTIKIASIFTGLILVGFVISILYFESVNNNALRSTIDRTAPKETSDAFEARAQKDAETTKVTSDTTHLKK